MAQLTGPYGPAAQSVLDSLPPHSAELEAAEVWRRLNRWLRHNENVPEAVVSARRFARRRRASDMNLLRTAPDPLVWAHGGLHDKQIIVTDGDTPLGLLDFDSTARAEAALDLANLDVHLELRLRENRMAPERYRRLTHRCWPPPRNCTSVRPGSMRTRTRMAPSGIFLRSPAACPWPGRSRREKGGAQRTELSQGAAGM